MQNTFIWESEVGDDGTIFFAAMSYNESYHWPLIIATTEDDKI